MFESLDHIIFFATDMKRATQFYKDCLGLKIKIESPQFTSFQIGNQWIALHPTENAGRDIGNGPLVYLRVSDIEKSIHHFEKSGVKILSPAVDMPTGRIATFLDSEGNALGLFQPKR